MEGLVLGSINCNCVERIAIFVSKRIGFNSFKNKITLKSYLNVCKKKMTNFSLNCHYYMAILEIIYLCTKKKKMSSNLFKNVIYKLCLLIIYLIYMSEKDLTLNNL